MCVVTPGTLQNRSNKASSIQKNGTRLTYLSGVSHIGRETNLTSTSSNFLLTHPNWSNSVSKRIYGSSRFQKNDSEDLRTTPARLRTRMKTQHIYTNFTLTFGDFTLKHRIRTRNTTETPQTGPMSHPKASVGPTRCLRQADSSVWALGALAGPQFKILAFWPSQLNFSTSCEKNQKWFFVSYFVVYGRNRPPISSEGFFGHFATVKTWDLKINIEDFHMKNFSSLLADKTQNNTLYLQTHESKNL